jgi:transcriptional regulator with XRE-family HTH domain
MDNLSERLRYALKVSGTSQTDLAQKIKVKPQVIQYLCSGKSEKSKFTFNIAEALNIDVSWLAIGKGTKPTFLRAVTQKNNNQVPILTLKQIKQAKIERNSIDKNSIIDWVSYTNDVNHNLFALILNDQSMSPRFSSDTLVIFEPLVNTNINELDNAFVLAYIDTEDCILFRQLCIENDAKNLVPINQTLFKTISLTKDDVILGICKEARWTVW